jgi:hypothetical protein
MDAEFWNQRPALAFIRDYARFARISPDSLLHCVLARVSVATPPNVVLPPLVGASDASLNLFVAIVGGPGGGKGLAEGAARMLVPDIRNAVTAQPASGEGIPALFAARESIPEDEGGMKGETRLRCVSPRALLSIPEIGSLGGASSRQGSTVTPTLCSAWSGEALGGFNKSEVNRLAVPGRAYRLGLVTGVQPSASGTLFDQSGVGLPQRFLWAATVDPGAPDARPAMPIGAFPFDTDDIPSDADASVFDAIYEQGTVSGSLNYQMRLMTFPDCAYAQTDASRVAVLRGGDGDPLDSHISLVRAKVAGLLALMDGGRLNVSESDWRLAGCIVEESCQVRDRCLTRMHEARQSEKADYYADSDAAREQAEARKLDKARKSVLSQLERHDPGHEGVKGYKLRQYLGNNGSRAYQAIESLCAAGEIERLGDGSDTSSRLWSLPA